MSRNFMKTVSTTMFIISIILFLISLAIVGYLVFKGFKTKKRLAYLSNVLKKLIPNQQLLLMMI